MRARRARPRGGTGGAALRFLRGHLTGRGRPLRRLLAWSAVESLPALLSGLLVATALDRGFLAGRPGTGLIWLTALAGLWVVGAVATGRIYPWLAEVVEPVRDSLLTDLVTASLRSSVTGHGPPPGAWVTRATVQVETVRALLSTVLRNARQLLVSGAAALLGLTLLSPPLALAAGAFLGLAGAVFAVLLRVLLVRHRRVVLAEEEVSALAAPVVTGLRDVVAAGAQGQARREVGRAVDEEAAAVLALARARAWRLPVLTLGAHLPLLALLGSAPWLLRHGQLTVGAVVGGVTYLSTGLEPAVQVLANAAGTVAVSMAVVLTRLADTSRAHPPTVSVRPSAPCDSHAIALRHVSFGYSTRADPVLTDLSLDLPEGTHLAVVGPSGVGKSTLADLLTGITTPTRGTVLIGGVPPDALGPRERGRTVVLVPAEPYVFAGTVRENLDYLRPEATDAEVAMAVVAVGAGRTVTGLGGLHAALDPDTAPLSPADTQFLGLARAYLAPAGIVILDEATSFLDPVTEAQVEQAFARRGNTLIVIAHRMSSALRAQRVLVMDGAGTAFGGHDDLLTRSPRYAELVGYWTQDTSPVRSRARTGQGRIVGRASSNGRVHDMGDGRTADGRRPATASGTGQGG
ncbi:MAG: ABC transporter ATP-binding protein [Kineosporiaceae bacterium]